MASPQPASPRRSRGFSSSGRSERSEKSHQSSGSGNKLNLTETAEEKARRSLHTKADPMIAMSEAQPNLVALEKSNLGSLRGMQHKDQYGNPIVEPDLSNPTRPRFERPLDTIRSFEAAIYGPYSSRPASYARTAEDSTPGADYSRRSSYYNGYANGQNGHYNDRGYHNSRPNYSRPNSYIDNGNGHYNGGGPSESYYPYAQNGGRRPRQHPRNYSDQPTYANHQNGYSQNGHVQNKYYKSSDNVVASPSGSGGIPDQWANSTDPSSINSSLDQFQQQQQQQQLQQQQEKTIAESYGFQGFGGGPNFNEQMPTSNAAGKAPYGQGPAQPPVPDPNIGGPVGGPDPGPPLVAGRRHLQRKSIQQQQSFSSDAGDNATKRKSWFKRTFSKN
ncbi:hypothetical protein BDV12DRAFT_165287 [Aspergillus spectabilis]